SPSATRPSKLGGRSVATTRTVSPAMERRMSSMGAPGVTERNFLRGAAVLPPPSHGVQYAGPAAADTADRRCGGSPAPRPLGPSLPVRRGLPGARPEVLRLVHR